MVSISTVTDGACMICNLNFLTICNCTGSAMLKMSKWYHVAVYIMHVHVPVYVHIYVVTMLNVPYHNIIHDVLYCESNICNFRYIIIPSHM